MKTIKLITVLLVTIVVASCAPTTTPAPTQIPIPAATLTPTPAPTATPTATKTMTSTPTLTPTTTLTPTPDWEKFVPKTWDECASKNSESVKYWMAKARDAYEATLNREGKTIDAVMKALKVSGKYEKPNFVVQGSIRTSDGGVFMGYTASTFDAIAIGSQQCILNSRFGDKTGLNIKVNVGYFIPVDSPENVIAVVMNVTYQDDRVQSGTTVLGARGIHTISGAMQVGASPQKGTVYDLRVMAGSDYVSIAKGAIPTALKLVDPRNFEYYKQIGLSLAEVFGMSSKEEASPVLYSNGGRADAAALLKFVMDKSMMLAVEIQDKN